MKRHTCSREATECKHDSTHKHGSMNRENSSQTFIFFSPASLTLSADKPPLTFSPSSERVAVTSKVPLLGLELNLSKCFSLMFFTRAGFNVCTHKKKKMGASTHFVTQKHILQCFLQNNFSPVGLRETVRSLKLNLPLPN